MSKMQNNLLLCVFVMLTAAIAVSSVSPSGLPFNKSPIYPTIPNNNYDASNNLTRTSISFDATEMQVPNKTLTKRQLFDSLLNSTNYVPNANRRQFGGPEPASRIEVYSYRYPYIAALEIGPYTFTCRQTNGDLVIWRQLSFSRAFNVRSIPYGSEFSFHPQPGLWWFVRCVGFETGGYGLDATGVSKPGGDSGIDPNALKSLIG